MNKSLFEKNFQGNKIPLTLEKFFDIFLDSDYMTPDGFELYENDQNSGLKAGWSDNPEFLSHMFSFAQANHSGSIYALWKKTDNLSIEEMPVVLFGDEGGQLVIAENCNQFMQLLSSCAEVYIDSDYSDSNFPYGKNYISFYPKEYEEEDLESVNKFIKWVENVTGLKSLSAQEAQNLSLEVQKKLQPAFDQWIEKFPNTF